MLFQGSHALLRPILGTRSAVGGPETIKPLAYRPKPALDQLRLGMAGQAVLGLKDRKSTRLNSSHLGISYAVFCLKKKKKNKKKRKVTQLVIHDLRTHELTQPA